MSIGHVRVLIVSALLVSGATSLAAPEQDYPGQPTKGRVWVENRGKAEAVAVNLQNAARDAPPLKVEVIGLPEPDALPELAGDAKHGSRLEARSRRLPRCPRF